MIILTLIGRLFVIGFALFVAILAGSLFIGFGLASGMLPEFAAADGGSFLGNPGLERTVIAAASAVLGIMASFEFAGFAALPVTIAIAVSELMRWQSMTVHLVLGGLCALFVMFSVLSLPSGAIPANGTVIVSLAAGFITAFFYWLIAGRNAGEWLSPLGEQNPHSES